MKNIELLAPAGDQEALIAAVQNGADAIYLGGTLFNARAFAKNFDHEQLIWAIEYAHLRNIKIYVTVNTLYKDDEFDQLIQYLDFLYDIQVDALIIQDIGLFDIVKSRYPDFEIHMSTQASIMNVPAVRYFEKQGAQRVVLARENTIEEIREICRSTPLDIEVFVHGALCVCYSGQCLMSSFIGKRSGNRGECAQPCRLQYKLKKDNQILEQKLPFLLSPKDLMTIESVGDLIDAGVHSFKIEGRMKKPEYVASVVKAYRKAIDAHLNKRNVQLENEIFAMKSMFNRNYTNGYINHDNHIVDGDYSGNKGIIVGEVIKYDKHNKHVIIRLSDDLAQGDSVVFENIDKGRPINKIYKNNKLISSANRGDIVEIEFDYYVSSGNVRKTSNTQIIKELKETYSNDHIKHDITMDFYAYFNQKATLTIKYKDISITKESTVSVEKALKTPLDEQRIIQQLTKLGNSSFQCKNIHVHIDENITMPIKALNELRRLAIEELTYQLSHQQIHMQTKGSLPKLSETKADRTQFSIIATSIEQLEVIVQYPINTIYYPYQSETYEALKICQKHNKELSLYIPSVCKSDELNTILKSPIYAQIKKIMVNDYGAYELFQDKERVIGSGLNIYNSYACNHYPHHKVLSLEMSKKEINHLITNQNQCIVQIYGKAENMISEYCPISQYYFGYQNKNCHLCKQNRYSLIDRKNETFDLMMDEQCRMHLLNCKTLFIDKYKSLKVGGYLLHFTNENSKITKSILDYYILHFNNADDIKTNLDLTLGYFKS